MEDSEIIRLVRESPSDGLRAVLQKYGALLKNVAAGVLGAEDPGEAEECISDALLAFWKARNRFDAQKASNLKAYLCKIVKNTAVNRKRGLARRRSVPLECELPDGTDLDADLIRSLNGETVRAAVEGLSEPDRSIFIRRYYRGEPVKVIAEALGLSGKTVENRLYRNRAKLRDTLMEGRIIL